MPAHVAEEDLDDCEVQAAAETMPEQPDFRRESAVPSYPTGFKGALCGPLPRAA